MTANVPERASKKLRNDELLVLNFAASRLRIELDRVLLRGGNHVSIQQLAEDFGRYLYLPRLQTISVLLHAIRDGLELLTWEHDAFAYAENYDESVGRYRGLRSGPRANITEDDTGLLVRPEVARRQIDQEAETDKVKDKVEEKDKERDNVEEKDKRPPKAKRYHGTVVHDSARVGRDVGRIADEVITHLVCLVGASVRVTLEIEAEIPGGAPDSVVWTGHGKRPNTEFTSNSGFETE